ncbi:MAG: diguanylate cyclase [Gallionella sp.]
MEDFSWTSDQGCMALVEHLQDGLFAIEDGILVYANLRLAEMFSYPVEKLLGQSFIDLVAEEDRAKVMEKYHAHLAGQTVAQQYDIRFIDSSGKRICCSLNVGLSVSQQGTTLTVGSARDVTLKNEELRELEAKKSKLEFILDQLPDIHYRTNMQGIITMISPACHEILGHRPEDMLDTAMASYYNTPEDRLKVIQSIADADGKNTQVEAALRHKDGSIIWVSSNAAVRSDPDGKHCYIEGIARDITSRKHNEDHLVALSSIDSQTGAYTRRNFMDKAEETINMVKRYNHIATLLVADLDHFKQVNDNYGHHAGDLALAAFGKVCLQEIREPDIFGRLGGEEFGLMLPETPIAQAKVLAERIRNATEAVEITVDGRIIKITVSIGLAEVGSDEQLLSSVMRRADQAMYQAKENGRNQIVVSAAVEEPERVKDLFET